MGFVGEAINDLLKGIEDITVFFIGYSLFLFIAGEWYGMTFRGKEMFWYPLYILFAVIFTKVVLDAARPKKKK